MTIINDDLSIPEFLKQEDTPERKAARAALTRSGAKAVRFVPQTDTKCAELTEADEKAIAELQSGASAKRKAKSRKRIGKMLAKKEGALAAMPLTGKAALAKIGSEPPPITSEVPALPKGGSKPKDERKEATVKTKPKKGAHNGHDKKSEKKTLRAKVIDLARRKGGVTLAEVLKVTGWPSISMPQVAESQGVKLEKVKREGETVSRYFVVA